MNPRTLGRVRRAGLLGLAMLWAGWTPAHGQAERELSLREIAPGVHVHVGAVDEWGVASGGDVANLGIVIGERCVAVIDTGGTAAIGQTLKAAVRRLTALPVCYLINTHAHPDHVLGNEAFVDPSGKGPQVVGHHRLPAALQVRGPFYLKALIRDFGPDQSSARIVPPSLLVTSSLEVDLGERRLRLQAWPTAHTDADLSVLDVQSGTLFLGDLLFRDHTPVVDGRLRGWLAVTAQLRTEAAPLTVPGHGQPTTEGAAALQVQQRYLETLQADVRAALKAGWTLSQTVQRTPPSSGPWQLLDAFHARNVTAAYAELEWED